MATRAAGGDRRPLAKSLKRPRLPLVRCLHMGARTMRHRRALLFLMLSCAACAEPEPGDEGDGDELPLGDLSADDLKADGQWGYATTCKVAPTMPTLAQPEITISLDGLTLRLTDRATGWTKVYPVGVGAMDWQSGSRTYGESLSYYPIKAYGKQDFTITPSSVTACKIWWTDPETGERLPVFAGLPFLS